MVTHLPNQLEMHYAGGTLGVATFLMRYMTNTTYSIQEKIFLPQSKFPYHPITVSVEKLDQAHLQL